jgi:hypothetical protein
MRKILEILAEEKSFVKGKYHKMWFLAPYTTRCSALIFFNFFLLLRENGQFYGEDRVKISD